MHLAKPFSWRSKSTKRSIIIVIAALIAFYVVFPNVHAFGLGLHGSLPKNWTLMLGGTAIFFCTFIFAAISYRLLAFSKIKTAQVFLVQLASMTMHVLLPAGIGQAGVNYFYLRGRKHSSAEALVVVGMNNLVGVAGNVSMLILLLIFYGVNKQIINVYGKHRTYLFAFGAGLVVLLLALVWFLISGIKLARIIRHKLIATLAKYRGRWAYISGAYICSLCLSSLTALSFFLILRAYGINLSYPLDFLIYALSILIGTVIPTPGGLGAVEASMTACIVAVHGAPAGVALSAVLAYRAASYWLPFVIGMGALAVVQKLKLIRWRL